MLHTDLRHRGKLYGATLGILGAAGAAAALLSASPALASKSVAHKAAATDLTVAVAVAPATLDPRKLDNGGGDLYYAELAYDSFLYQTPTGAFKADLATSWKEVGKGNKTYVFKLRPNVKFSDGTAMTAQDAAATITAEEKAGTTCASDLAALKSVTATGPLTVTLKYSSPQAPASVWDAFSQNFMCGDVVGPNTSGTVTDGTGPYMLDAAQTTTGSKYVYVPNPYYWNKSLKRYKTVTLDVYSSITEELSAIKTGAVDFVSANGPQAAAARRTPGVRSYLAPFGTLSLWLVDFKGKLVHALANQKVRQALEYAINRPQLAKEVYAGTASPNDEITVAGYQGFVPSLQNYYKYNPAKAKALLKQAGYPHGFTFTSIASSAVGYETPSEVVAAELAQIGVTDKLQQEPNKTEAVTALFSRKYPAFVWGFGAGPLVASTSLLFGKQALFNPFHNAQPAQLLNDIRKGNAAPGNTGTKYFQQAEAINTKEAYEVGLLDLDEVYLVRPGVISNVDITPRSVMPQGPDIAFYTP